MGSSVTGEATKSAAGKAAQHHGKPQPATAKKPASGKRAAKKKKAAAKAIKESRPRGTAGPTTAATANVKPATAAVPDSPADDPRSLAWMSERAVSALNAVQAHQAEKAKELLAKAEKPPIRHTTPAMQPVAHRDAAATGKGTASAPAAQTGTDTVPPVADSLGAVSASDAALTAAALPRSPDADKPASAASLPEPAQPAIPETPAATPVPRPASAHTPASRDSMAAPEPAAAPLPTDKAPAPAPAAGGQPHVSPPVTAVSPHNRLPLRPAVLAGVLAVMGLLVYWSWPGTDEAAGPATVQDALPDGNASAIAELPQAAVITVVAGKPSRPAATAATEAETASTAPTRVGRAAPVSTPTQPDQTAAASASVATDAATPPATAGQTAGQTTVPAESPAPPVMKTQPANPVPPARTTRPVAPHPRYPAPGYGQGWQQPYYPPAYPRYPSR